MTRLAATQANRGMGLEKLINETNETYLARGIAVVNKRPIPVLIKERHGTHVSSGQIVGKSTVDYEGVYRGHSLQFEAKSTRESNRFPLDNFHEHQVEHMRACMKQGAIVFAILEFTRFDQRLYVPGRLILNAWDKCQVGGPASIPREALEMQCWTLNSTRGVFVDYLAVVDKLLATTKAV